MLVIIVIYSRVLWYLSKTTTASKHKPNLFCNLYICFTQKRLDRLERKKGKMDCLKIVTFITPNVASPKGFFFSCTTQIPYHTFFIICF